MKKTPKFEKKVPEFEAAPKPSARSRATRLAVLAAVSAAALAPAACSSDNPTVGSLPAIESCDALKPAAEASYTMPAVQQKDLIRKHVSYAACRKAIEVAQHIVNSETDKGTRSLETHVGYTDYKLEVSEGAHDTAYYRARFGNDEQGRTDLSQLWAVRAGYNTGGAPAMIDRRGDATQWTVYTANESDPANYKLIYPLPAGNASVYEWHAGQDQADMILGQFDSLIQP